MRSPDISILSCLAFHRATIPLSLQSERQFTSSFHTLRSCLEEHRVYYTDTKRHARSDFHGASTDNTFISRL